MGNSRTIVRWSVGLSVLASWLSIGAQSQAQTSAPEAPQHEQQEPHRKQTMSQERGGLTAADRAFAEHAARGGKAEVELATLAEQQASAPPVKKLAQQIRADHEKANAELQQIATSEKLTLPNEPGPMHRREKERLAAVKGAAFDRAYVPQMITEHQKDIKEFEAYVRHARNERLKSFAENALPTLRKHLQMAQATQQEIRSGTR